VARGRLVERKRVLAGQSFLLPRLDLLLAPRRHRLHDAIDERADVLISLCDTVYGDGDIRGSIRNRCCRGAIAIMPQGEIALVLVLLALLDDRKLRNFRRRFGVIVGLHLSSVGILDFRKGERREGRLDGTRTRFGLGRGCRLMLSAKAWPDFL
jgi:hypothetical protein